MEGTDTITERGGEENEEQKEEAEADGGGEVGEPAFTKKYKSMWSV